MCDSTQQNHVLKARRSARRWKSTLGVVVILLWTMSAALIMISVVIRKDLGHISLVTEGTDIGEFYLKLFFPVIFPVLVSISCFVFIFAFLGCFGAFTDNNIILGWYFFSMFATFFGGLSLKVWRMVVFGMDYGDDDIAQMQANIAQHSSHNPPTVWFHNAWSEVHRKFNCCGVVSFEDWYKNVPKLLQTCCPAHDSDTHCIALLRSVDGCGDVLLRYLGQSQAMYAVSFITAALGILQVIAMAVTLKLWFRSCVGVSRDDNREVEETTCTRYTVTGGLMLNAEGHELATLRPSSLQDRHECAYGKRRPTMWMDTPACGRTATYTHSKQARTSTAAPWYSSHNPSIQLQPLNLPERFHESIQSVAPKIEQNQHKRTNPQAYYVYGDPARSFAPQDCDEAS